MKLVIFSICMNEEATIGELLKRVPKQIKGITSIETLIVSDGSTDDTVGIAKKFGANKVINGKSQKRLAYRFQQAVDTVLEMGADIAVNIDGDLQFAPEDIPKLVEPILSGRAQFVAADRFTDTKTGARRKPKNMPSNKYWANRLGSWITGVLSGQSFRDVTCGFRAYNKKALLALNIHSPYTYTQESFQILAAKKFDIVSIPTEVKYFPERKSRVVVSFTKFLFGSAINILRAFRDFSPLKFFGLIALINIGLGGFALVFSVLHWFNTGMFSPYKFIAFSGLYLFSFGLIVFILGLVADMFQRVSANQEKIIEKIKEIQLDSK